MNEISLFYNNFSILNDIFYKDSHLEVVDFLRRNLDENTRTLDCGCGDGQITKPLLDFGFDISGFDISKEMLSVLKSKVDNNRLFIVKDALEIAKEDLGKFSQAYCVRTSFGNHRSLKENRKYLENIYDILNKEGVFYLDYLNFKPIMDNFKPVILIQKNNFELVKKSTINNNFMEQEWEFYNSKKLEFKIKLGTYIFLFKEIEHKFKDAFSLALAAS